MCTQKTEHLPKEHQFVKVSDVSGWAFGVVHSERSEVGSWKFKLGNLNLEISSSDLDWNTTFALNPHRLYRRYLSA